MNKTNRMCKNITVYKFCERVGERGDQSKMRRGCRVGDGKR